MSVTEAINREQAQIDVLHANQVSASIETLAEPTVCDDARANVLKVLIPDLVLQVRQWHIPKHPRPGKLRRIQLRAEHESRKQALAHAWAHENARNYLDRQDIAWCSANLSFV